MASSLIVFRASFETEDHQRFLDTQGSAISVAEAKIRIAKELALEKEFARRFDLLLKLISPDGSERELRDDYELVMPGSNLVVQRTLWRRLEDVVHRAEEHVTEWKQEREAIAPAAEPLKPKIKEPLPKRFICIACGGVLRSAMVVRCASSCNASVCKVCAERLLAETQPAQCPQCKQAVKNFIPNKTLIGIITKLDLSLYILPDRHEAAEPPPAPVEAAAFMIFLRPQQIQVVHEESHVLIPTANYELVDEIMRSTQAVTLIVFGSSGGGTSLLAPGILKVTQITGLPTPDAPANCHPAPDAAAKTLEKSLTAEQEASIRKTWVEDDEADNKRAYILCRCTWELRFDSVALLPGKAQPIAGIWSGARRVFSTPNKHFESTRLSPAHKQGISTRLGQEALYSRSARNTAPPPSSNSGPPPSLPPPQQQQPQQVPSVMVHTAPTHLDKDAAPQTGGFVFNPAANAWTGSNPVVKDRFKGSLVPANSKFTALNEELAVNPLLPLASLITKLDRPAFLLLQRVQELALQLLAAKGPVHPDLMKNLRGIKGNVFNEPTPPSSMGPATTAATGPRGGPAEPPKGRRQRSAPRPTPYDMMPRPHVPIRPQQVPPQQQQVVGAERPPPTAVPGQPWMNVPVMRRRPQPQQPPQPRPVYQVRPWVGAPDPMQPQQYMPPPRQMMPVRPYPIQHHMEEGMPPAHVWAKPRMIQPHDRPLYPRPVFTQQLPPAAAMHSTPPGGFYSGIQSVAREPEVSSSGDRHLSERPILDRDRDRDRDRVGGGDRDRFTDQHYRDRDRDRERSDRDRDRDRERSDRERSDRERSDRERSERERSERERSDRERERERFDRMDRERLIDRDRGGRRESRSRESPPPRYPPRGSARDFHSALEEDRRSKHSPVAPHERSRSSSKRRYDEVTNGRRGSDSQRANGGGSNSNRFARRGSGGGASDRRRGSGGGTGRREESKHWREREPLPPTASDTSWRRERPSESKREVSRPSGSERKYEDEETSKRLARQQRFGTSGGAGVQSQQQQSQAPAAAAPPPSQTTNTSSSASGVAASSTTTQGGEKRVFLMVDEFRKAAGKLQEKEDRKRTRTHEPVEGASHSDSHEPLKRRRKEDERRRAVHLEDHSPAPPVRPAPPEQPGGGRREDGLAAARLLVASLPQDRRHRQSSTNSLRRRRRPRSPQPNNGSTSQSNSKKRPRNSLYT